MGVLNTKDDEKMLEQATDHAAEVINRDLSGFLDGLKQLAKTHKVCFSGTITIEER